MVLWSNGRMVLWSKGRCAFEMPRILTDLARDVTRVSVAAEPRILLEWAP